MIKQLLSLALELIGLVLVFWCFSYPSKVVEKYGEKAKELQKTSIHNIIPAVVIIIAFVLSVIATWNHNSSIETIANVMAVGAIVYIAIYAYFVKRKIDKIK